MEVPDTFVDLFEDLGIVNLKDQGNLIKLLYKYSLPAMEYARNKMRFRKTEDIISLAVQDIFGKGHYLAKSTCILHLAQELMMTNDLHNWTGKNQVYVDLVMQMRSEYERAHINQLYFDQRVLSLFP